MVLRSKRAALCWQLVEHFQRPRLVDQNVTAVTRLDRFLRRTGIARDHNAAVRGVKSISVALHSVLRGECRDCDLCVFIDNSGLDFMSAHLPPLRVTAL